MTDESTLLSSKRASVIAPAGCGKTELIARTVNKDTEHRSLVLTHTYAGVDALRKRFKKLGTKTSTYTVDTIAGWSLRLVISFPGTSNIKTSRPRNDQWDSVYIAAAQLLYISAIKSVIQASYDAVYVDEYQDCSPKQHDIVLKLADILPTRILGDPLQGIFDFGDSEIIDWSTHVKPNFEELPQLNVPYRWANKNPDLGEWLMTVRNAFEIGKTIDIRQAPNGCVEFIRQPTDPRSNGNFQRESCMSARCRVNENFLVINSWESQCHKIARMTGGKFRSPETIECNKLFDTAKIIDDASDNKELARLTFEFACFCLTKVKNELGRTAERIFNGTGLQQSRKYKHQQQLVVLEKIAEDGKLSSVYDALLMLKNIQNVAIVRYELFHEMLRSLKEYNTGKHDKLEEAAIIVRDRTRRTGRYPGRYVISRTLLVKGLEFDHVMVFDANILDRTNLYVALTRGSKSLKVVGNSAILNPK
ncbi:MAG: AAA family ATPase [Candidatus Lokiarchaeota archaeon]|nr:AAA family ATPase [Candidatus Lokiarchaeota archaeon]